MKTQAERATRAEIDHHIERQKTLGELMIDDHDTPRSVEILAVIVVVAIFLSLL